MLKGNNSMNLNEATMMQIVQEWLERNMSQKPVARVASVTFDNRSGMFIVQLAEIEEKK